MHRQHPLYRARHARLAVAAAIAALIVVGLPAFVGGDGAADAATDPAGIVAGSISAGLNHTCAIQTDGTLTCWGDNASGQLAGIPAGSFAAISAGSNHTCAIRAVGTLACWGNNASNQLTAVPAGTFAALSAGLNHTCGIRTDGTLACWGDNSAGQLTNLPPAATTFLSISAGDYDACGIKTDHTLSCWGNAIIGIPPAGTFTSISSGSFHTCGIKTDGTLSCWGDNSAGQRTNSLPPAATTFTAISAGILHTCGIKTDGTLACWGNNALSQLTGIPAGTFTKVEAGGYHACAVRTNGTLACWGYAAVGQLDGVPLGAFTALSAGAYYTCGIRTNAIVGCWGNNGATQVRVLGVGGDNACTTATGDPACWGDASNHELDNVPGGAVTAFAVGRYHMCGLRDDRTLVCWGDNTSHQLDNVPGGTFTALTAGLFHTCAIKADTTVACWGDNSAQQLANVPSGGFKAISAGDYHTCGIRLSGALACWGNAVIGAPPAGTFTSISSGSFHTCGLKSDNTLSCWGDNTAGQRTNNLPPAATTFTAISAGSLHTCGIRTAGTLSCWGSNGLGQLTNSLPAAATTFTALNAGAYHTCGIKADGTIACWGDNTGGQLTGIPVGTFTSVDAGLYQTCGIRTGGVVACWGNNTLGQRGVAPAVPAPAPASPAFVNAPYTHTFTSTTGTPAGAFSTLPTALPPGLSLGPDGVLSGTPTAAGSFTFTVTASDGVFADASAAFTVAVLTDNTRPTTTITLPATPASGWYTGAVHASIGATDGAGSGVAETRCQLDGTAPAAFGDMPVCPVGGLDATTDGTHVVYAASKDRSGNVEVVQSATFKIDQTPPATSASAATADLNPYAFGAWTNQDVTVTLAASDARSGVDKTYYSVDDPACSPASPGSCTVYGGPFTVTAQGVHAVRFFSIDVAGNKEGAQTAVVKIERQAPASTITLAPASPNGSGGWYNTSVHVSVAATDTGGSGVAETRCVLDPLTAPASFDDLPAGCAYLGGGADVNTDGTHTVYAATRDSAGNKETPVSSSFKIDATPPVTTFALDPANPEVNGWYVFAVKPTVTATDGGSAVAATRCQLDGTPPATFDDLPAGMCPYTAPSSWVMTEGIHTIYAASEDGADNKESIKMVVFKIDKTGPVSALGSLSQFQGAGTFPVAWSATDNLSGVASYDVRYRQASSNGTFGLYTTWFTRTTLTTAPFTTPAGGTTCFSVRATDVAGWTTAAWTPEQCTTVPLDDPALARSGAWSTVTGSGYFGPGVSRSTTVGSQLTVSMRGQTIGVLVTRQPGGGQVQLRWNGSTQATVSLSAASIQKQQLVTFALPSVQSGTLAIVQTGYGTVDIDGAGASKTS